MKTKKGLKTGSWESFLTAKEKRKGEGLEGLYAQGLLMVRFTLNEWLSSYPMEGD
ncbi:MAG: hypothetical protein ACOCZX_01655 [Candidatus Bipolaricaulota bacterium]